MALESVAPAYNQIKDYLLEQQQVELAGALDELWKEAGDSSRPTFAPYIPADPQAYPESEELRNA